MTVDEFLKKNLTTGQVKEICNSAKVPFNQWSKSVEEAKKHFEEASKKFSQPIALRSEIETAALKSKEEIISIDQIIDFMVGDNCKLEIADR